MHRWCTDVNTLHVSKTIIRYICCKRLMYWLEWLNMRPYYISNVRSLSVPVQSSVWRTVRRIRGSCSVTKLPSELHHQTDLLLLHHRVPSVWWVDSWLKTTMLFPDSGAENDLYLFLFVVLSCVWPVCRFPNRNERLRGAVWRSQWECSIAQLAGWVTFR